jgi:rubrerythrin
MDEHANDPKLQKIFDEMIDSENGAEGFFKAMGIKPGEYPN